MASKEGMLFDWLGVHDDIECQDCWELERNGPYLYEDLPTFPGAGDTVCGKRCRCTLVPHFIVSLMGITENKSALNFKRDLGDFVSVFNTAEYSKLSTLVDEFQDVASNYYVLGDWNLPDAFYTEIFGLENREKYLKELIDRVRKGTLSADDIASLQLTNAKGAFAEGLPGRL